MEIRFYRGVKNPLGQSLAHPFPMKTLRERTPSAHMPDAAYTGPGISKIDFRAGTGNTLDK